ncbi:MAG: glutathione S-transferase [Kordiimonadaceae bacterium]|nr:glutathione S-transferase [Kordiimonadaceae bacterium]MBO6567771.1 glutathione S-transferase [Kordiimonadaceae bacterium]MBO6963014.1 glutathione S-transferase [Kordiimonadaceae bacterium]
MIKVHHLNNSRSQRILWFLEELGVEYEIINYTRDLETNLAPDSLKEVHPLGKSPVIEDGDVKIAESGAATEYLAHTYGNGEFSIAPGEADHWTYVEWLHYAEGSLMLPLLLRLYTSRLGEAGEPLAPRIQSEIANHFTYTAQSLGDKEFFAGGKLTGADIQMSFPLEAMHAQGGLAHWPNLAAYVDRIHARPAYLRALERGGDYAMGPKKA